MGFNLAFKGLISIHDARTHVYKSHAYGLIHECEQNRYNESEI